MRRIALALFLALALVGLASNTGSALVTGVPRGTPVHMHTHPDNGIVSTVQAAAARVGLGPIEAVGFERNCTPMRQWVLVCRDKSLQRPAQPTSTAVGPGWCVVRLDPTLGPGAPSLRVVTAALRRCLS